MRDALTALGRNFVRSQVLLSGLVDRLVPAKFRTLGIRHFRDEILPRHLGPCQKIYDVGGGSVPCISLDQKKFLNAIVVGLDIDAHELAKAPAGCYDTTIVADITNFRGAGDADLVICRAVMEHVRDASAAFRSLATILREGGRLLIVVPSRNALFARVNLMLPEKLKRCILFSIFPHKGRGHDGFPAFYDRCTPRDFRRMARASGFVVEQLVPYYYSTYFTFFVPFFILWRIWVLLFALTRREQAAEVFSLVCRKEEMSESRVAYGVPIAPGS